MRRQIRFLRRQFLQEGNLPFTDVLTSETIAPALEALSSWKDRVYPPLVTLWVFLGQVLSADPACRAAVARLIAHRLSQGLEACSAKTGAYCQARGRLPEKLLSAVTCLVGRALDAQKVPQWLWKGRPVYMFDGTVVSMPDTAANQAAYPQPYNQRPGLGFPIPIYTRWSPTKHSDLANLVPEDTAQLKRAVHLSLKEQATNQRLKTSFFKTAQLRI